MPLTERLYWAWVSGHFETVRLKTGWLQCKSLLLMSAHRQISLACSCTLLAHKMLKRWQTVHIHSSIKRFWNNVSLSFHKPPGKLDSLTGIRLMKKVCVLHHPLAQFWCSSLLRSIHHHLYNSNLSVYPERQLMHQETHTTRNQIETESKMYH